MLPTRFAAHMRVLDETALPASSVAADIFAVASEASSVGAAGFHPPSSAWENRALRLLAAAPLQWACCALLGAVSMAYTLRLVARARLATAAGRAARRLRKLD